MFLDLVTRDPVEILAEHISVEEDADRTGEVLSSSFTDCWEAAEDRSAEAQHQRQALHGVFRYDAVTDD